jgi:hypothetical protein
VVQGPCRTLDPNVYRERAAVWRQRALLCDDENQQNACIVLADGYDRLADLLDAQVANREQLSS